MRFVAPARGDVDPAVFARMPLAAWSAYDALLRGDAWPPIAQLNRCLPPVATCRFAAQTPALLADGLHYEQRIAERGEIATRDGNWHDLFNALAWMRHPALKHALNRRQVAEIVAVGTRHRTRAQDALTHFDEGGVVVALRDPALLALWDAHDWHGLFWRRREAWDDGAIELHVFGHALLEHALDSAKLLVGKALVFRATDTADDDVLQRCAHAIAGARILCDPAELRPLPLSGIPGWHPDNHAEAFHRSAPCYQARRAGRVYPPAL